MCPTRYVGREQITPFFLASADVTRRAALLAGRKMWGDQPKPNVVVRVVAVVPVVIGDAGVVVIVVPRTATQHAVFC